MIVAYEKPTDVTVRRVSPVDIFRLFHWANDLETRNNAFNQKPIRFPSHVVWFLRNYFDRKILMTIATKAEQEKGQAGLFCRFFPRATGQYEITVNLAPELRGQNLSRPFLNASISVFRELKGYQHDLFARVKASNLASEKLFLSVGFAHTGGNGLVHELRLPTEETES